MSLEAMRDGRGEGELPVGRVGAKTFLVLLTLCFLHVGISLIWQDRFYIDPDTFDYVSVANYYLYSPDVHVRDAFTVGPVIPALIAAVKFLTLKLVQWSANVDVLIVKAIAFICYVVMTVAAFKILTRHVDRKTAYVVLFFVLGLLGYNPGTLSLNGELVAVPLLCVLMVVLAQQERTPRWRLLVALLSVIIIYTKLQATPILLLLLASESNSKKDFAQILLYLSLVLLGTEVLLYLNGAGLSRNLISLYVYISKGSVAGVTRPEHVPGVIALSDLLMWVPRRTFQLFPFVYIVLGLILCGKSGNSRNVFSDWKVWLVVTFLTIVAPTRSYEHYLMFWLPFTLRFAGPAVAGIGGAVMSAKRWRYLLDGMVIFLCVELLACVPGVNPLQWPWARAFPAVSLGQPMDEVRALIRQNPGRVFVNGWDYSTYCYLNTFSNPDELPLVMSGVLDESAYVNSLVASKFDYLVDVVDYSGISVEHKYALSYQGMAGVVMARYYDKIYDKDGLRLYRLKSGPLPPFVPLGHEHRIPWSLVSSSVGCPDCLPEVPGSGSLPAADRFGTFRNADGIGTGEFVVSFVPQGPISGIKYTASKFKRGLSIDVTHVCTDGRRIGSAVDVDPKRVVAVNEAYIDNGVCPTRSVEVRFSVSTVKWHQWLGILGVTDL